MSSTIEMVPRQTLSFSEFVRLSEQQRKVLGQVTIIPPQLGHPGFGCVVVEKPVFVEREINRDKPRKRKRRKRRSAIR